MDPCGAGTRTLHELIPGSSSRRTTVGSTAPGPPEPGRAGEGLTTAPIKDWPRWLPPGSAVMLTVGSRLELKAVALAAREGTAREPGALPTIVPRGSHGSYPPRSTRRSWSRSASCVASSRRRPRPGTAVTITSKPGSPRLLTLNLARSWRRTVYQAVRLPGLGALQSAPHGAGAPGHRPDVVARQEADDPSVWTTSGPSPGWGVPGTTTAATRTGSPGARSGSARGTGPLSHLPLERRHSHRFRSSCRDTEGFVLVTLTAPTRATPMATSPRSTSTSWRCPAPARGRADGPLPQPAAATSGPG